MSSTSSSPAVDLTPPSAPPRPLYHVDLTAWLPPKLSFDSQGNHLTLIEEQVASRDGDDDYQPAGLGRGGSKAPSLCSDDGTVDSAFSNLTPPSTPYERRVHRPHPLSLLPAPSPPTAPLSLDFHLPADDAFSQLGQQLQQRLVFDLDDDDDDEFEDRVTGGTDASLVRNGSASLESSTEFSPVVGSPPRRVRPKSSDAPAPAAFTTRGTASLFGSTATEEWLAPPAVPFVFGPDARAPFEPVRPAATTFKAVASDSVPGAAGGVLVGSNGLPGGAAGVTRYVRVDGFGTDADSIQLVQILSNLTGSKGVFVNLLASHGLVVACFYDTRAANAALNYLPTLKVVSGHRGLSAFCLAREGFAELSEDHFSPHLSRSEGILVLCLLPPPIPPPGSSFHSHQHSQTAPPSPVPLCATIGPIRQARPLATGGVGGIQTWMIEYWDERDAERAAGCLGKYGLEGWGIWCSLDPSLTASTAPLVSTPSLHAPPSLLSPSSESLGPLFTKSATPATLPSPTPTQLQSQHDMASSPSPARATRKPSSPVWGSGPSRMFGAAVNELGVSPRLGSPVGAKRVVAGSRRSFGTKMAGRTYADVAEQVPPVPTSSLEAAGLGTYRDEKVKPQNVINLSNVEKGLDVRTTIMLKNVPNRATAEEVMKFVDDAVGRCYDFFYLRFDYNSQSNVGYCFVNLTSASAVAALVKARKGTRYNLASSDKLCIILYADTQGKESLVNRFRNSAVMLNREEYRPRLFHTDGPLKGLPEEFPAADDQTRLARSAANVSGQGLFPAQKPKFKIGRALQTLNC